MLVFPHLTWIMSLFSHRHAVAVQVVDLLKVDMSTLFIINDVEKAVAKFEQFKSSEIENHNHVVAGTWFRLPVIETHISVSFFGGLWCEACQWTSIPLTILVVVLHKRDTDKG